jgi:hypothetical protein
MEAAGLVLVGAFATRMPKVKLKEKSELLKRS